MSRIPLSALIGLLLTGGFFFVAIFALWIAPYRMDELIGGVWDPISAKHWLGTDSIGRDLLSRMIFGAQVTIFVATASTILSFVTGSVLGFLAAVAGGWLQNLNLLVSRATSIKSSIFRNQKTVVTLFLLVE